MMEPITQFSDRYRFLSNFFPADVMFDGLLYPTAEHAYVAAKTNDRTQRLVIQSLATPGKAKRYGRELELRENWDKIKVHVMRIILHEKFSNKKLREMLDMTAPLELIEGNTWGDTFWGQCPIGNGQNHLGKILMSIRDGLDV